MAVPLKTGGRQRSDQVAAANGRKVPGLAGWLSPVLIVLLTGAAFLPTLENGFVRWDDHRNFLENPHYRGLGWTQLRWMFTTFHMSLYRPLSWVTSGLDYLLWEMNPVGYHLTNLLLHAANALVFYLVTLRLFPIALASPSGPGSLALRAAAGFAALVFALHPLRVEPVAWASARNDVLSGLFFLWTILCYLRATMVADTDRARPWWLSAAVIAYTLSLLSKASGMTLPIILLVLDVYPLGRLGGGPGKWFGPGVRRVWIEKIPFVLLSLGAGVIALVAKHQAGAMRPLEQYGLAARIAQTLYGLAFYLWKSLVPLSLSPLYPLPTRLDPFSGPFLLSGAVVLAASVGLIVFRRRWPAGLATWVCYVVLLAPVLGIAQSGPQLTADRYSYLSCLGWALLAGAGLLYCWRSWVSGQIGRRTFVLVTGLAAVVVVGLGVLTWYQVQVWHDSKRLWRHALAVTQDSSLAHYNLANVLNDQGEREEAIEHYRQALQIQPAHARAHYSLAKTLANLGKIEEAIYHYLKTVEIQPDLALAHYDLGTVLYRQGKLEEAIHHYQEALRLQPAYAEAHNNLGVALAQQGQLDEALDHFRQTLRIRPVDADVHYNLGQTLRELGRLEEAIASYQTALDLAPKDWPFRRMVQRKLNETREKLQEDR